MLHHGNRAAAGNAGAADPYFDNVTLLLTGDGTNGAQNNTFLDSSTNNFTITRNGNTTQGTFSPYGNLWSNYFDGSGDYLSIGSQAALGFGTGNWTIETWVYAPSTSSGTSQRIWSFGDDRDGLEIISGNFQSFNGAAKTIGTANANTWVHVAGVRNSGTIYWYINGILATSYVDSTNSSARTLDIGTIGTFYSPKIQFYTGYISNLRIVKGTALYTSNFTPSTTPLTAVSGTSLLTCQSKRFIDNSSNNFTLTVNGNTSVQRFSPFNPTAAYSASTIGGSGYFDGTGDYLSVNNNAALQLTGDFTLEFFVYVTTLTGSNQVFISKWNNSSQGYLVYFNTFNSKLYFDNTATSLSLSSASNFLLNRWNHVAVTRSGNNYTLYLNGVSEATSTSSNTATDSGTAINIGRNVANSENLTFGYISNLRIVKGSAVYTSNFTPPTAPLTAITNTSLLCNFTNAGIPDAAMMNNLETVGNAQVSTSVKKYGTGSLYFDGSGDWLRIPNSPWISMGTGDFTWELWAYVPSATQYQTFIDTRSDPTSTSDGLYFGLNTGTLTPIAYINSVILTSTTSLSANTWTHLALVRSSGTLKIYVNGVASGSVANTTNFTNSSVAWVGGSTAAGIALTGYIDDLRITKGLARYTANFTPPTAALPTY